MAKRARIIVEGVLVEGASRSTSKSASKSTSKSRGKPGRKREGKTIGGTYYPLVEAFGYTGKKQSGSKWPGKNNKVYNFKCPKCGSPKGHKCVSASGPVRPHKERWVKAYGQNYTA